MDEITLIEAVNRALAWALNTDPDVILIGEDIGKNGGVFRATIGLQERFGAGRVRDTPLSENLIAGMSVGMASMGLKPVAEIQFMGFMYAAFDQIISHASRLRHRTRGRLTCPLVIRSPYGAGIHAPEHHSESTEALFAHIPGLRVVIPSSPLKAYGLLLAAIQDKDPVIFLEPSRIYRLFKQVVPDNGETLPLDTCFISREGKDISLVSWGASLRETLEAATQLSTQGIEAEVIDVATIKPLDMETILASVSKTGRCVIVHEAVKTLGVGAEIAARLAEEGLMSLLAPIKRVTGYDTVVPLSRLEHCYIPSVERIIGAVHETMTFS
ncbi:MAG: hypothetical protein RLZ35_794 [Pseudomonadota bacterium]|jgi:pyruvate dehydrogenase E1 component beta subunit